MSPSPEASTTGEEAIEVRRVTGSTAGLIRSTHREESGIHTSGRSPSSAIGLRISSALADSTSIWLQPASSRMWPTTVAASGATAIFICGPRQVRSPPELGLPLATSAVAIRHTTRTPAAPAMTPIVSRVNRGSRVSSSGPAGPVGSSGSMIASAFDVLVSSLSDMRTPLAPTSAERPETVRGWRTH